MTHVKKQKNCHFLLKKEKDGERGGTVQSGNRQARKVIKKRNGKTSLPE